MKLGVIGFGNMAEAIVKGILEKNFISPAEVTVSRRNKDCLKQAEKNYGIRVTGDNREVVRNSEVILLCVKPQMLKTVIDEIRDVTDESKLVISIAAGKSLGWLQDGFQKPVKLVRTMPNTPALVGEGCTGICYSEGVSDGEKQKVQELFDCVGKAHEVTENLMDVVGGISGCSPAFVFLFMEAMADGAVAEGMPRKQAYEFAAQAVLGSAKLMLETGKHPGELKDMVCSPAGTTIQGVRVLEENGLRGTVMDAVIETVEQSKNL